MHESHPRGMDGGQLDTQVQSPEDRFGMETQTGESSVYRQITEAIDFMG